MEFENGNNQYQQQEYQQNYNNQQQQPFYPQGQQYQQQQYGMYQTNQFPEQNSYQQQQQMFYSNPQQNYYQQQTPLQQQNQNNIFASNTNNSPPLVSYNQQPNNDGMYNIFGSSARPSNMNQGHNIFMNNNVEMQNPFANSQHQIFGNQQQQQYVDGGQNYDEEAKNNQNQYGVDPYEFMKEFGNEDDKNLDNPEDNDYAGHEDEEERRAQELDKEHEYYDPDEEIPEEEDFDDNDFNLNEYLKVRNQL